MSAPPTSGLLALLAGAGGCLGLAACDSGTVQSAAAQADPGIWFVEVAERAGLDFAHVSCFEQRFDFPEIMGGGVGLIDVENDGWLDVYLVQSGDLRSDPGAQPTNRLFANRRNLRFEDVTDAAGVGDRGYGMGCAVGDADGDGRSDLFVTNVGPNVLYLNRGERFTDASAAAGIAGDGWSVSAVFCDPDLDGDLDLFVVDYLNWSPALERDCSFPNPVRDYCAPTVYAAPARDTLWENQGAGTFVDATERLGLAEAFGNGLGAEAGDFDDDGHQDLYVANDMSANQLWLGGPDGRFRESGLLAGCALSGSGQAESGMGVQAVDLEDDGDLDLFLTHLRGQTNTYYRNDRGRFVDATARLGLAAPSQPFTGFGTGFADFDNDGDQDLFVANGHVIRQEPILDPQRPYAQENQVFEALTGGRFRELEPRGGVSPALFETSRGCALGDLDNDGAVDVVVVNRDARAHLLHNRAGARGRWILLSVVEADGAPAIAARVSVRAGGRTFERRVGPNYGYASSHDPRVHVGLGSAERVDQVRVRYPGGGEQVWTDLAAGRVHELRRDGGR